MALRASDPLDILLAHNLWATRVVLERCRGLSDEEFRRPFPIGPGEHGGLHAILTHIIGAMRRWADRIGERPGGPRPPIERWRSKEGEGFREAAATVDEMLVLLEEAHRDLAGVVAAARRGGAAEFGREVEIQFPTTGGAGGAGGAGPKRFVFTKGVGMVSGLIHGHYHRAQCVNILRQYGVAVPALDVIDWQEAGELGLVVSG